MAVPDFVLKIKEIPGESQDSKHKNAIEIVSWSFGVTNAGSETFGGGGGVGKSTPQDFHFTGKVGKAAPKMFQACASGQHLEEVQFICRKAGSEQQEYLIFTLKKCFVSSCQLAGSSGDVIPMLQFSINFGEVKVEYSEQDDKGNPVGKVPGGYDFKANKVVA